MYLMGKPSRGGGNRSRNDERKSGKGWKKNPGAAKPEAKANPKYVDGYSPVKLAERAAKRNGTGEGAGTL
jgi:hypothetical protein